MTSPTPHLDLDALADALAGEGDAAGAAHLAGCGSCASRLDELVAAEARVIGVLGALPPPAVPADLADRLTAALAGEAPLRPAAVAATVTALPAQRDRPRRAWLPAAAAAVLLASGAGLGVALLGGGGGLSAGSSSDDAASPAGALAEGGAADRDLLLTASGTDWADPRSAATALPRVLSGGADRVELSGPELARDSGTESGAQSVDELEALRTSEGLAACLSAVLPPGEPDLVPLAVDYASYDGEPALAVVLPDADPAQVSVFVVSPGCTTGDDRTLFFLRAPRP